MTTLKPAALACVPLAALLVSALLPPAAVAASCREELDQFERELNGSSIAARSPDLYAELARSAEEASELRDEQLCMQRVAELRSALADADDADAPPATTGATRPAPPEAAAAPVSPRAAAPPAAALLLEPAPVDYASGVPADGSPPAPENDRRD